MSTRSWAKEGFFWGIAHSGLPWVVRATLQRGRATVLCYHDPEPEVVRRHLRFLRSRYNVVALRDIVAWVRRERDELPSKAVAITLDDGWAGNSRLEEVFREHGVVPTVFVCTRIVGTGRRFWWQAVPSREDAEDLKRVDDATRIARLASAGYRESDEDAAGASALDADELLAMRGWADVQSHTRFHPVLTRCDEERAWSEIAGSRDDLQDPAGAGAYALAYPNGDRTGREVEMAKRAGYECAFTIDAGFVERGDDPYELDRIPVDDTATLVELVTKASGIHHAVRRMLRRMRLVPDWA